MIDLSDLICILVKSHVACQAIGINLKNHKQKYTYGVNTEGTKTGLKKI